MQIQSIYILYLIHVDIYIIYVQSKDIGITENKLLPLHCISFIFLQDLMDIFFRKVVPLKNVFGKRAVTKDIGETFNNTADFIKFATHGYAILAAMHILDMNNVSDVIDIDEKN